MASNKKNQKPTGQNPELDDEAIDGQDQAADDAADEAEGAESTDLPQDQVSADADEAIDEPLSEPQPTVASNLHGKLEKTVRSINTHAGQEKVFALHQIELLTGRLKMALPAAIAAADDSELKAALATLLHLL